ncbi:mycoredoxin [Corynebacterium sp. TAE3-ERU12]|uniref:mycoredoxin n=1 Tax=Corynebacterium sp. TAE3-ERU12 TaxID=2849491 RepID=UPI001C47FFFF|nr:mycoredoxin [Corynebacterium sp. TAE3-ERU12]MBV7294769.1 mycoredoxin [Corynebacterium sp. TAE3-ERU12]
MDLPKTSAHVTIYATSWCPHCAKLIASLKKLDIPFEAWDVEKHEELGAWVESVNDGNRIVPTVLYSDGTHATNPPAQDVKSKYEQLNA